MIWPPSSYISYIFQVTVFRGWYDWGGSRQYQRKNRVSALRKYFMQCKVNNPPAAFGDARWRSAAWSLPWRWINGIWGGAQFLSYGQVGEQSALMGYACLSPCSVFLPSHKNDKWKL